MKRILFLALLLSIVVLTMPGNGPTLQAQSETAGCLSFTQLASDFGTGLGYTIPLAYGSFADVELAPLSDSTTQVDIEIFEQSALRERRIHAIVPRRVELLTDIVDEVNLFDIGRPLYIRISSDRPVNVTLVRHD